MTITERSPESLPGSPPGSFPRRGVALLALPLVLLTFAGCASTDPGPAFDYVKAQTHQRLSADVVWDNSSEQDKQVHRRVAKLLDKPLTADAAVQVALLNNADLQGTYEDLGIAQADLVAAGLLRNPVLSGSAKLAVGGGSGQIVDLSVTEDFFDVLFIPLRKSVARAQLESAKRRVTAAAVRVAGDTRRAFVRAQADGQLVSMMRQVARSTDAALTAAQAMRDAGNVPKIDVDRQRAMDQRARLDLSTVEQAAIESRESLARQMGVWGGLSAKFKLAGRLPDVPDHAEVSDGLVKRALSHSVDLAASRAEGEALARGVGLSGLSAVFDELSGGVDAEGDSGDWFVGPGGSISLPILNFGQAASARAKARVRQALWRYAGLAVRVRSQTRTAAARLAASRDRADYLKQQVLPTAQRVMHQSQLRYNAMQIGVFKLLQAKRDQIDAGRSYIESLRDYWFARADLDEILAGALPTDMSRPTTMPELRSTTGAMGGP